VVVAITAPPEVLAERVANRARSSDGDAALRLRRAVDEVAATPDVSIVNVGRPEQHAERLIRIIRGH
jgi:ribose 1,5-bisphosphokinase